MQLLDLGAHGDAQRRVEVGERLVHEEGLRLAHERAAERDALALAAGELVRSALEQRLDLERARRVPDAALDLGLRMAAHAQAKSDVLAHRLVRVERVALEHHRHVALVRGHHVHERGIEVERAGGDVLEAGDQVERGRLAAARGAEQHDELLVGDLEIQVRERDEAVGVGLARRRETNGGHRQPFTAPAVRPETM